MIESVAEEEEDVCAKERVAVSVALVSSVSFARETHDSRTNCTPSELHRN